MKNIIISDACDLPLVVGPCNGTVLQYYYEKSADACYTYDYGGCLGNKNRFENLEVCERRCKQRRPEPQPPVTEVIQSSAICSAPPDAGPCNQDVTAYYYDKDMSTCQAFIYGGCEGNSNRFQTEEQCERLCGSFQGQGWGQDLRHFLIDEIKLCLY